MNVEIYLTYPLAPFVHPRNGSRVGAEICKVRTPREIVELTWKLTKQYRDHIADVVDFGAGDGRFALSPNFDTYYGVEYQLDQLTLDLPMNARLVKGCALDVIRKFDLSIGNPPYVQHHLINPLWKKKVNEIISDETGFKQNALCNMFVYFLWLSLLRTEPTGLIVLITPYEWVSRPSAKQLRAYIRENQWQVDVYQFENSQAIFPRVLTTAAITIIDKSRTNNKWTYFQIKKNHKIVNRLGITDSPEGVLPYTQGGIIRARRGFSPGSQKVFMLSEQERLDAGIEISNVAPAVTSLRSLSKEVRVFDYAAFKKYYVNAGQKCWLLITHRDLSQSVKKYLAAAPEEEKNRWTCQNREVWYQYSLPLIPRVLYSSGFVQYGPKVILNRAGTINLGSVHGIIGDFSNTRKEDLVDYLRNFDFESRIVPHAKTLKKVEVNQMNGVLDQFFTLRRTH